MVIREGRLLFVILHRSCASHCKHAMSLRTTCGYQVLISTEWAMYVVYWNHELVWRVGYILVLVGCLCGSLDFEWRNLPTRLGLHTGK